VKFLVAAVLAMDLMAVGFIAAGDTAWINSAKKSHSTNPFFSKGITVTLDNKKYEIGFRNDGMMVWREPIQ